MTHRQLLLWAVAAVAVFHAFKAVDAALKG